MYCISNTLPTHHHAHSRPPRYYEDVKKAESSTFFNHFFGNMMPPALSKWTYDDMTSDAGFSRFSFVGFGVIYMRKLGGFSSDVHDHRSKQSCFDANRNAPTDAIYCLDLHWMSQYAVRDDFERYGATAYFGATQQPLAIHRPANTGDFKTADFHKKPTSTVDANGVITYTHMLTSTLGDENWEHMKWTLKVSVMTEITLIDHLLWAHLIVSNGVTKASRETLDKENPIRQLLKPFTYRANTINFSAFKTLFAEGGMADHWFGFTRESLGLYMETCSQSFSYKDPETFMNMMGIPKIIADDIEQLKTIAPLLADGLRLYHVFRDFSKEYVDWAYTTEADLAADSQVAEYWTKLDEGRFVGKFNDKDRSAYGDAYKYGLKPLTKEELYKQVAHLMFYVTGYHRVVGNFADYLESGSKSLASVIRPGYNEGSVLDYFGISTLAAFTGFPQINLINDWRHVFLTEDMTDTKKTELFAILEKWQGALADLSVEIETESRTRPIKQHMMNPRHLDVSIAI